MRGSRRVRVKQAMRTVLRSLPQGVWVNFGGWKSAGEMKDNEGHFLPFGFFGKEG